MEWDTLDNGVSVVSARTGLYLQVLREVSASGWVRATGPLFMRATYTYKQQSTPSQVVHYQITLPDETQDNEVEMLPVTNAAATMSVGLAIRF